MVTAKGELKDEEEVSKAQLGAFFAAMTIRANAFPEPTQWSEGERRAMEAYWPHLIRTLPSDIIFLADPEGSIMRLGNAIGPQYVGNGSYEMRLVGALREVLADGHGYEEVQGVLKDVLPLKSEPGRSGTVSESLLSAFLIGQRMNREINRELKAYCLAFDDELGTGGITEEQMLKFIRANTNITLLQAKQLLEDEAVGFAYFPRFPPLHLSFRLPDALCTKYHIPASLHPSLLSPEKSILQSPDGKIGVYTRFFDFANYRLPLSQFLVDVLDYFRIYLSQFSVFKAAKVSHFEILCRVHGYQPSVNLFRAFYTSSYTKGWMPFSKRSDTAPVCHSKPLDSVKNWNDHFFGVDSKAFPLSVSVKNKILSKDPPPKLSRYDTEACEFLRTHTAPFWKFPEPFLCWVGISRYYTLDENSYLTFWDGDEGGWIYLHLFVILIPLRFGVGERNLADRELKLLKMTEGRTVALDPPGTAASGGSSDSIDRLFDEGYNAGQEHSTEKDDDVQEEVIAKDALEVVAEKPQKKRKRKVTGDAIGYALPPKKLRDDHQSLPPSTGGKSLSALRNMVSEGSVIPSDAMRPIVTASVTLIPDVEPVDSVSGLNLRTRPPHMRYVVSLDSSHHSGSYSKVASLIRSAADAPVVTVTVTTTADRVWFLPESAPCSPLTADANIATGSKVKGTLKDFEHTGDSASAGGVDADAGSISKLKNPSISSDSFYASQSLDTESMRRVYIPRWKLRVMDYDQLYSEFNVGAARQVCLGAEVRMRAKHTLEKKGELEDRCAEQTVLLSEKDAEIAHLKSLLSLKEAEAAEAISLRSQLFVVEAVDATKALECAAASKEVELASLSSQVSNLSAELNSKVASLEFERDCLATQKGSLESALELFKEQIEKMHDEQMGVMSERVATMDSDLMEMALYMDSEFYPRFLTNIAGRRWILSLGLKLDSLAAGIEHGTAGRSITDVAAFNPFAESDYVTAINVVQGVRFSLLAQLEANKDASMADIMDLLRLEGPAVETSKASQLQPSFDQLMIPIHHLEDQVIIGESSLAFSLEVAHNRVLRLRGDAATRRLSLTDSILLLVEPLSARNLTGEASSSADVATAVKTALSTTFVQTNPITEMLSTLVPQSPKVVFEEEELDTTPEHVPAP
ncbi:hypothetical protein Tco_0661803 [Tanacetum coccineum]